LATLVNILKNWTPPIVKRIAKYKFREGWHGNYKSFEEARRRSTGYDSQVIFDRVREAALKVKNGEGLYERSAVIYHEPAVHLPLLGALSYVANHNDNRLTVMDVGGALGGLYFQHKQHLQTISELHWCIVEQKQFVEIGRKEFADETLHFFESPQECAAKYKPDIVFFCGSMQYFERPYQMLKELFELKIPYFFLCNIAFIKGDHDRIAIQKVPAFYYVASYPCWFLSKSKFLNFMKEQQYELLAAFDEEMHLEYRLKQLRYEGMWFRLNHLSPRTTINA